MGPAFWLQRFVLALLVAGGVIFVAQLAKGHSVAASAWFAALWGTVSAGLFTLVGYVRYKRNPACMRPRSEAGRQGRAKG